MTAHVAKNSGWLSLFNGASCVLYKQLTYSTARFAFYEGAKEILVARAKKRCMQEENKTELSVHVNLPFYQKMLCAGIGGGLGSLFGSPADVVMIRMQNDIRLPVVDQRNYKNFFEAVFRITSQEGFSYLFAGFQMTVLRGM
jgi:hypothetical protein